MANCNGKTVYTQTGAKGQCRNTVFKCQSCGHIGCDQGQGRTCSLQGFLNSRCVKCGHTSKKQI